MQPVHPKDPRNNPGHRERGPKRHTYTLDEVAGVLRVSRRTLSRLVRAGKVDPSKLESVVAVALERRRE